MAKARLKTIHDDFKAEVLSSCELLRAASSGAASKVTFLSVAQRNLIIEHAFLRIFRAWERFLEAAFIAYMMGKRVRGQVIMSYAKPLHEDHALMLISGVREFPDWTRLDQVNKLAQIFFEKGEPFVTPLQQIEVHFHNMKRVRNAIVHISVDSQQKFLELVRSELASYRSDITPGEFLYSPERTSRVTFFQIYTELLEFASDQITPI